MALCCTQQEAHVLDISIYVMCKLNDSPPRTLLMLMFSIADQGPIEGWALTHAMHHVASDAGL